MKAKTLAIPAIAASALRKSRFCKNHEQGLRKMAKDVFSVYAIPVIAASIILMLFGQVALASSSVSLDRTFAPGFEDYPLDYGKYQYHIPYKITGASIQQMRLDCKLSSIIINLQNSVGGDLTITIPRKALDASDELGHAGHIIIGDGKEVPFEETNADSESRTLHMTFANGAKKLEIIAAYIPELIPKNGMPCGVADAEEPPFYSLLPPLRQLSNDVPKDQVQCREGLVLASKSSDDSPACVRPETKQMLVETGWASVDHAEMPKKQAEISAIQYRYSQEVNKQVSDFYVKIEGTGYNYYPPKLWISNWQNQTVWTNPDATFPKFARTIQGDFCKEYRFYDIGGPVILNDTGTYTMHMSFEDQLASYQLSVKEKQSESNPPTYGRHCDDTLSEHVNGFDNFIFTIINQSTEKASDVYVQIDGDIRIDSELDAGAKREYGFLLTEGGHTMAVKSKEKAPLLMQDFVISGKRRGYLSLGEDSKASFELVSDRNEDLERRTIIYDESSFLNTVDLSANGIPRDSEGRVNYGNLLGIISKDNYVKIFEQNDMPITINDIYLITGPDIAMYHESGYQCGYVNYSNQTFWLESKMNKDTLTELKVLNDNPDKCRPSYDSCFCMVQHHLAENSITKLSYFDESQTSQVAKSIQDYFSDGNKIANVQNLFAVGKYNFDLGTGITPFCGQFKGKSNGWYFHGAIKEDKVVEFSLDLGDKQKLCAISDNPQVYTFDESAIVK